MRVRKRVRGVWLNEDPVPADSLARAEKLFEVSYRRRPLGVAAWRRMAEEWVMHDPAERAVDYLSYVPPRQTPRLLWLDRLGMLLHSMLSPGVMPDWSQAIVEHRCYVSSAAVYLAARRLPCGRRTHPRIRGLLPPHWAPHKSHFRQLTQVQVDIIRCANLVVVPAGWRPPDSVLREQSSPPPTLGRRTRP